MKTVTMSNGTVIKYNHDYSGNLIIKSPGEKEIEVDSEDLFAFISNILAEDFSNQIKNLAHDGFLKGLVDNVMPGLSGVIKNE